MCVDRILYNGSFNITRYLVPPHHYLKLPICQMYSKSENAFNEDQIHVVSDYNSLHAEIKKFQKTWRNDFMHPHHSIQISPNF